MKQTNNNLTRKRELNDDEPTRNLRLRNTTPKKFPKMMKHRVVVYREKTATFKDKPLKVISIRVSEEDAEFLHSLPNASEFLRDAIATEKRKQATLETKGLPSEIINEIAQAYTNYDIDLLHSDKWDLDWHNEHLSDSLFNIAQLTLRFPNPLRQDGSIMYPLPSELEQVIEELQSKEAKAFIQRIYDIIIHRHDDVSTIKPLDEDEYAIIRKIFDEAKLLLEKEYRKTFHKLPPDDWHLTTTDGRQKREHDRLRYKLP
jgi:hypothetical protein